MTGSVHRLETRRGMLDGKVAEATFSIDGRYRYKLSRQLTDASMSGRAVTFVMLNPSDADEARNDATVRRCIRFAARLGADWLDIVNIFGLVAHQPRRLLEADDSIGPANDWHIRLACLPARNRTVIAAWGAAGQNYPRLRRRMAAVVAMLDSLGSELHALGDLTAAGQPRHPLYLKADAPLRPVHLALGQNVQG